MDADRHRWLAERAYLIWQHEGCPEGSALRHWLLAEEELCEAERKAPVEAPPARKSVGARAKPAGQEGTTP